MDKPLVKELSLYNGVSNRSRGWKTKRSEKVTEPSSSNPDVMRWDGASRSSSSWDYLRRDPELWHRDGNCYIHLYGQGHSRRGPAFKVPFSALLEAKFHPLIDKFMAQDVVEPDDHVQYDTLTPASYFSRTQRRSRIELFIPAPPQSDKRQSYNYHLAMRNLIAFALRRSMVGETLGSALSTLMRSMYEFRTRDVDNIQDMIDYMDEEGYLYFINQPTHALALLHLGETFQLRELYVNALAHCCGMNDRLFMGPGYNLISSYTRKLIRRTRVEMDERLGKSGSMLTTFLQDELSDVQLGLFPGARAHLERFRTLLHEFYAARFGYYPPPSIDPLSMIYDAEVFRTMRDDFDALYQYLVDDNLGVSQNSAFLEQGGICTLWSVRSFDARQKFETLLHPLPLLPDVPRETTASRKVLWLGKQTKPSQSHRDKTYAALLKATNQNKRGLLKNELVQAYRWFEGTSTCQPSKADRLENLGPTDARKVRWVLIYAIYQVLRQATDPPPEVKDFVNTPYHVSIPTANLPVWDQRQSIDALLRDQADQVTRNPSISTTVWSSRSSSPPLSSMEIKPDIDYLAMTQRDEQAAGNKEMGGGIFKSMSRGSSLTRSLSRNLAARRPLSIFTKQLPEVPNCSPQRTSYHEIVVHWYGNGTSSTSPNTPPASTTSDLLSSINEKLLPPLILDVSVNNSSDCSYSEAGTAETPDTSVAAESPSTASTYSWDSRRRDSGYGRCCEPSAAAKSDKSTTTGPPLSPPPTTTPVSPPTTTSASAAPQRSSRTTTPFSNSPVPRPQTLPEDSALGDIPGPGPSRPALDNHQRSSSWGSVNRGSLRRRLEPPPLNIRKSPASSSASASGPPSIDVPALGSSPATWDCARLMMEVEAAAGHDNDNDNYDDDDDDDDDVVHPEWELYSDLGGLREPKAGTGAGTGSGSPGSSGSAAASSSSGSAAASLFRRSSKPNKY
ncbi:hypothetical protein F4809DRAFT_516292 [Biscogniauxia mediterranea]|nr:hypothetical protein F4809DRAFT_516292 [Biscogniauxia mediterranea]